MQTTLALKAYFCQASMHSIWNSCVCSKIGLSLQDATPLTPSRCTATVTTNLDPFIVKCLDTYLAQASNSSLFGSSDSYNHEKTFGCLGSISYLSVVANTIRRIQWTMR